MKKIILILLSLPLYAFGQTILSVEQNVPLFLPEGWSMFGYSCYESVNVIEAFEPVVDKILLVKDSDGVTYLPEWNFNGIGDLEYSRGYQIKVTEEISDFSFCPTLIVIETNLQTQVGDLVEGGIVFYINETGQHGLVAAIDDLTEGATDPYEFGWNGFEWGCYQENVDGANGTSLLTGYQNIIDISNQECLTQNGGLTAALASLYYESEGYNDWYIPSKDELVKMYTSIGQDSENGNIGGFSNHFYWSSSEDNDTKAWGINFLYGFTFSTNKELTGGVRVIRAF